LAKSKPPSGIRRAVDEAGGVNQLAEAIGVTHQAVYQWLGRGWVPLDRAAEIETQFGVPRSELANPRIVSALLDGSDLV
jgi:DNA-binding transcriptional regulator YdaS (Cro superfamily)